MDGKDITPGQLCESILSELFDHFQSHVFEKLPQNINEQADIDIGSLFSPALNPLYQDYMTYFSILSQHTLSTIINSLYSWYNKMFRIFFYLFII